MTAVYPHTQAETTQHLVSRIFFIQKKNFQPHTGGVWVGGGLYVQPWPLAHVVLAAIRGVG